MISTQNNKLTIVIPTYNRYPRLLRLLRSIKDQGSGYKIAILDSSSKQVSSDWLRRLLKQADISYSKFDPQTHVYEKLYQGLKSVTTEYVVICADDDLMNTSLFAEAIEFLDKSADYSMVCGQSIWFDAEFQREQTKLTQTCLYPQKSITDDSAAERLRQHLFNYTTSFYSIQRTKNAQNNFQICHSWDMDLYISELLLSCLSVIQGKFAKVDKLFMVRERFGDSALRSINRRDKDFFDTITRDTFPRDYARFHNCLRDKLITTEKMDAEMASTLIKEGFWHFLSLVLRVGLANYSTLGSAKTRLSMVKEKIKLAPGVEKYLIPNWRRIRHLIKRDSQPLSLAELLKDSSKYHNDFIPVYRQIQEPLNLDE